MLALTIVLLIFSSNNTVKFEAFEVRSAKGYDVIVVDSLPLAGEPGRPWIPVKTLLVLCPNPSSRLEIEPVDSTVLHDIKLAPTPKAVPLINATGQLEFSEPDPEIYNRTLPYPSAPVKISGIKHLLGLPVREVLIYPVKFYPSENKVVIFKKFRISTPKSSISTSPLKASILSEIVVNPEAIRIEELKDNEGFDYLIVTSSALFTSWSNFMDWKRQKGYRVALRTVEWIVSHYPGWDNAERIRNYLKTLNDSGTVYLLLGGDTDVVPFRYAFAMTSHAGYSSMEDSIPADLYFGDLDGTWDIDGDGIYGEVEDSVDMLPDLIVGRAPVSTPSDVATFTNKVITYELNHPSGYSEQALFAASYLDDVTDGGYAKDAIAEILPSNISVTRLYERNGNLTGSSFIGFINYGYNFINHDGHASTWLMQTGPDYVYLSDFDELSNSPKFSAVLYSIGCWAAAFDDDCIAEHFVMAPNGGGFFIGNSRFGWYIPQFPGYSSSDLFDKKFFEILTNSEPHLGAALAAVKAYYAGLAAQPNDFRWAEYTVNLLGDPELTVFTPEPQQFDVLHPDSLVVGQNSVLVTVRNSSGIPVDSAVVAFTQGNQLLAKAMSDPNGNAHLDFELTSNQAVTLTVTKHNFEPLVCQLPVSSVLQAVAFLGMNLSGLDDVLSPSEITTLTLSWANISGSELQNIHIELNLTGNASLLTTSFDEPSLAAGETLTVQTQLTVSGNANDGDHILIAAVLSADGIEPDTAIQSFAIYEPKLEVSEVNFPQLMPCGTASVEFFVKNVGFAAVNQMELSPVANDSGISILSSEPIIIQNLISGDSVRCSFEVAVDCGMQVPSFPSVLLEPLNDIIRLAVGYEGYIFDFEDGASGWTLQSPWHITSYRSHTGSRSLFFGNEFGPGYPSGIVASATSPPMTVPPEPVLSFWTYYDIDAGWDFLIVEYQNGTEWRHLVTLGGPSDGWQHYEFELNGLAPGDETRVRFTFYSENDERQYEGCYIDDLSLSCSEVSTDVEESEGTKTGEIGRFHAILSGGKLLLRLPAAPESPLKLRIYDISGRQIYRAEIHSGSKEVALAPPFRSTGIYFLRIEIGGKSWTKKLMVVR